MWLNKLKHSIEECDHKDEREKLIRDAQERVVDDRDDLAKEKDAAATRDAAMIDSLSCTEYAVLRRVLVWLALVLEAINVPFQFIVMTVGFPVLSITTRWTLSPFIAVGEAVLVHAVAYAGLFDRVRPRRTVRICLRSAGGIGIVVAIAGTILLFSRTASAEMVPFLLQVVPVSLWIVAEGLPVVAGLVAAAAHVLHHPVIQRRRIRRLDIQIAELNRFLSWLEGELDKLSGLKTLAPKLTAVLLLAAAMLIAPQAATAQQNNTQPGPSPTAQFSGSLPGATRTGSCDLFVDWSRSVSEPARRNAVGRIRVTAAELVRQFGCENIKLARFSDEGAFAPVVQISVAMGSDPARCPNELPVTGVAKAFTSISGFSDYYRKKNEQDCALAVNQAQDRQRRDQEGLERKIEEVLDPSLPASGECTAIRDLVSHQLTGLPRLLVIVTDGVESCSASKSAIDVPRETTLVLMILPSKGAIRISGPAAMARVSEWRRILSHVVVAVPSDIAAGFWSQLAVEK